jgi:hypothetical protein
VRPTAVGSSAAEGKKIVTMNGNMTTGLWFKNTGKTETPIL